MSESQRPPAKSTNLFRIPLSENSGVLVSRDLRGGRIWWCLHRFEKNESGKMVEVGKDGLALRLDELEVFAAGMHWGMTSNGVVTPRPDLKQLADLFRLDDLERSHSQRDITTARVLQVLAQALQDDDEVLLRDLDREAEKHLRSRQAGSWAAGAPSLKGSGRTAQAPELLMGAFEQLCKLSGQDLDEKVRQHGTFAADSEWEGAWLLWPDRIDHEFILAFEIISKIAHLMPHLPVSGESSGSPAEIKTLEIHPAVLPDGTKAQYVIRRVLPVDGSADACAAKTPFQLAVDRLAEWLRDTHRTRVGCSGAGQNSILKADDMETVLKAALRCAGVDAEQVNDYFKFLDRRKKRHGSEDPRATPDRRKSSKAQRGRKR